MLIKRKKSGQKGRILLTVAGCEGWAAARGSVVVAAPEGRAGAVCGAIVVPMSY